MRYARCNLDFKFIHYISYCISGKISSHQIIGLAAIFLGFNLSRGCTLDLITKSFSECTDYTKGLLLESF